MLVTFGISEYPVLGLQDITDWYWAGDRVPPWWSLSEQLHKEAFPNSLQWSLQKTQGNFWEMATTGHQEKPNMTPESSSDCHCGLSEEHHLNVDHACLLYEPLCQLWRDCNKTDIPPQTTSCPPRTLVIVKLTIRSVNLPLCSVAVLCSLSCMHKDQQGCTNHHFPFCKAFACFYSCNLNCLTEILSSTGIERDLEHVNMT